MYKAITIPLLVLVVMAIFSTNVFPGLAQPNTDANLYGSLMIDVCKIQYDVGTNDFGELDECDHDMLYIKGKCEKRDNQWDYCYDVDLDKILDERGISDSVRPPYIYCDMNVAKCEYNKEKLDRAVAEEQKND